MSINQTSPIFLVTNNNVISSHFYKKSTITGFENSINVYNQDSNYYSDRIFLSKEYFFTQEEAIKKFHQNKIDQIQKLEKKLENLKAKLDKKPVIITYK